MLPDPEKYQGDTITVVTPLPPDVMAIWATDPKHLYSETDYPGGTFINPMQWQESTYHKQIVEGKTVWKLKEVLAP